MADRGKRLEAWLQARIRRMGKSMPIKRIAKTLVVDRNTVRKYLRKSVEVSPPAGI